MTVFYIAVIVICTGLLIRSFRRKRKLQQEMQRRYEENPDSFQERRYPYRPDVEVRLPNGRITTRGYAARNPEQFAHWAHGPENVYGEYIDRQDWEEWRSNYYGD